jgi:hypothetical protein
MYAILESALIPAGFCHTHQCQIQKYHTLTKGGHTTLFHEGPGRSPGEGWQVKDEVTILNELEAEGYAMVNVCTATGAVGELITKYVLHQAA